MRTGKLIGMVLACFLAPNYQARSSDVFPSQVEHLDRLGPAQEPFGYGDMASRWPVLDGAVALIPVCWEEGTQQNKFLDIVRDTINESWGSIGPVKFTGWGRCNTTSDGPVRIRVADEGPYAANLGKRVKTSRPSVVLNFELTAWTPAAWCLESDSNKEACIKAIAVHEFGHVLGLSREQNRVDAPGECSDTPAGLAQGPDGTAHLTPWDRESVMNYCHPLYREGGFKLSNYDRASIIRMYSKGYFTPTLTCH